MIIPLELHKYAVAGPLLNGPQADRLSGIDVVRILKKLAERSGLDAAKYAVTLFGPSMRPVRRLQELRKGPS